MSTGANQQLARALGLIPGGCFILTAGEGEQATGILASWVQQAGFDPPSVSVAVKNEREIRGLIEKTGHFVLNTLTQQQVSSPAFEPFGERGKPGRAAFENLQTEQTPDGVVIKDCIAHLGCKLTGKVEAGDHTIYVGAVSAAAVHDEGEPAIRIRTDGLKY